MDKQFSTKEPKPWRKKSLFNKCWVLKRWTWYISPFIEILFAFFHQCFVRFTLKDKGCFVTAGLRWSPGFTCGFYWHGESLRGQNWLLPIGDKSPGSLLVFSNTAMMGFGATCYSLMRREIQAPHSALIL